MKLDAFFLRNPVFTVAEIDDFLGGNNTGTRNALLAYHRRTGKIIPVRRGLYAVVPPGASPETAPLDPYLIASKITIDAVLAYHTALEVHGRAYTVYSRFTYLSGKHIPTFRFRQYEFQSVMTPKALRDKKKESFGVQEIDRQGLQVRVTDLERTFVDTLDRPDLCGGWEEVWRSCESIDYLKLDEVVKYVRLLGKSTTAAKVGFFLEQHREPLGVRENYLNRLRKLVPQQPHYLNRSKRKGGVLVKDWNLIIPEVVLERSWEEIS